MTVAHFISSLSSCTHSICQLMMSWHWPGIGRLLERELEGKNREDSPCKDQQGTHASLLQPFSSYLAATWHLLLFSLPLAFQEIVFYFLQFFSFTIKDLSTIFLVLISYDYRIFEHCLESNVEILIWRWYVELKISYYHYWKLSSKSNCSSDQQK